jgi:hypothetical protein
MQSEGVNDGKPIWSNTKEAEMSRSEYTDDCDGWDLVCWRGAVTSAMKGRRGQKFLIELRDALDAMQVKELIAHELVKQGNFCALGVVGQKRGIALESIDPEDSRTVAEQFNIANAMAQEIVFVNDEAAWDDESPQQRWSRMRRWVDINIQRGSIGRKSG